MSVIKYLFKRKTYTPKLIYNFVKENRKKNTYRILHTNIYVWGMDYNGGKWKDGQNFIHLVFSLLLQWIRILPTRNRIGYAERYLLSNK